MPQYKVSLACSETGANGRQLVPGSSVELSADEAQEAHNVYLIESGKLFPTDSSKKKKEGDA